MDEEKWWPCILMADYYTGALFYANAKICENEIKELKKILSTCEEAFKEYTWRALFSEPLIVQYWKIFGRGF